MRLFIPVIVLLCINPANTGVCEAPQPLPLSGPRSSLWQASKCVDVCEALGALGLRGGGPKDGGQGGGKKDGMTDAQRRIAEIEAEMARTQKNKATMGHLCALKARLAALKRLEMEQSSRKSGSGGDGFDVRATGDARVGFIGFPSVGKSTLLTQLTGVYSEAADYEFTTLTCVPGVMHHEGARIQILDLPGIIEGAKDGKGRGRQVIGCARTCDLILLVLDATKPVTHKILIEQELHGFGIRLNQKPPNIYFKKQDKGGLNYQALVKQSRLTKQMVEAILREYKIFHAEIILKQDATEDELIDVLEGNRMYIPCLHVFNKIDKISREEVEVLSAKLPHFLPISGVNGWNIETLKERIWSYMDLTRVYTKPKGQIPDFDSPVILRHGRRTVEQFCKRIHKRLLDDFRYALVWGASAKHTPQIVGKEHVLCDEDVIQVVKRGGGAV